MDAEKSKINVRYFLYRFVNLINYLNLGEKLSMNVAENQEYSIIQQPDNSHFQDK